MVDKKFSIAEALKFGWESVTKNLGLFLGVIVVWALLIYLPMSVARSFKNTAPLLYNVTNIVASIIAIIIQLGLMKVILDFMTARKPGYPRYFPAAACLSHTRSALFYIT